MNYNLKLLLDFCRLLYCPTHCRHKENDNCKSKLNIRIKQTVLVLCNNNYIIYESFDDFGKYLMSKLNYEVTCRYIYILTSHHHTLIFDISCSRYSKCIFVLMNWSSSFSWFSKIHWALPKVINNLPSKVVSSQKGFYL